MLTCIACTKQIAAGAGNGEPSLHDSESDDPNDTPNTVHAVKTLTSQIKDMALKASGAYRHCSSKPCSRSTGHHHRSHRYADSEKFHYSYRRAGEANSSSSTPRVICFGDMRSGRGLSSAEGTPSMSGRTDGGASCGGLGLFLPDEEVPKEWVAQVEPGVLITFFSLTGGGNDLKRIRFSREMFNKWQAQRWWEENADKIMELYNVQRLNRQALPVPTPPRSENEALPIQNSRLAPTPNISSTSGGAKTETSSMDASARTTSSSRDELSVSNASDQETEWVEQDEPGVYITIRALPGGAKELRRVRFNRERFGEMHARLWWEENRARIHEQYL